MLCLFSCPEVNVGHKHKNNPQYKHSNTGLGTITESLPIYIFRLSTCCDISQNPVYLLRPFSTCPIGTEPGGVLLCGAVGKRAKDVGGSESKAFGLYVNGGIRDCPTLELS